MTEAKDLRIAVASLSTTRAGFRLTEPPEGESEDARLGKIPAGNTFSVECAINPQWAFDVAFLVISKDCVEHFRVDALVVNGEALSAPPGWQVLARPLEPLRGRVLIRGTNTSDVSRVFDAGLMFGFRSERMPDDPGEPTPPAVADFDNPPPTHYWDFEKNDAVKIERESPPLDVQRPHIVDGEFQSDKYPGTPAGKVPLSTKDPTAQDLLWKYAQRRRTVDAQFADDLEYALRAKGYVPPEPDSTPTMAYAMGLRWSASCQRNDAEAAKHGLPSLEASGFDPVALAYAQGIAAGISVAMDPLVGHHPGGWANKAWDMLQEVQRASVAPVDISGGLDNLRIRVEWPSALVDEAKTPTCDLTATANVFDRAHAFVMEGVDLDTRDSGALRVTRLPKIKAIKFLMSGCVVHSGDDRTSPVQVTLARDGVCYVVLRDCTILGSGARFESILREQAIAEILASPPNLVPPAVSTVPPVPIPSDQWQPIIRPVQHALLIKSDKDTGVPSIIGCTCGVKFTSQNPDDEAAVHFGVESIRLNVVGGEKWAACANPSDAGSRGDRCDWTGLMSQLDSTSSGVSRCPNCGSTNVRENLPEPR